MAVAREERFETDAAKISRMSSGIRLLVVSLLFFLGACKQSSKLVRPEEIKAATDVDMILKSIDSLGYFLCSGRNFQLQGRTLEISGRLIFDGTGQIENGTIRGKNAVIEAGSVTCFDNVRLEGTWQNPEINLTWLVSGENALHNFNALTNIIRLGKVVLLDRMFAIATRGDRNSYTGPEDIVIRGIDKSQCGLILMTKHANSYAYFRSPTGNNIDISNITLTTQDQVDGKTPDNGEFRFAHCWYSSIFRDARPDLDFFKIDNCMISGNIRFSYGGNPLDMSVTEYLQLGVPTVQIERNSFENVVQILNISNLIYDSVRISENEISNIYGPVFFFPISGLPATFPASSIYKGRTFMQIRDNHVSNEDPLFSISTTYMSIVVAKGNRFEVLDNTFENVLNLRPGTGTYPFYCSASDYLLVKGNTIKNCGTLADGKSGRSSLCKLKGADNCDIIDNTFIFDRQGLVDLGLLSSVHDDPATIDSSKFQFSIFDGWSPGLDSVSVMRVERNVFKAAVLSDVSHIFNAQFYLKDNTFEIGHVRTTDKKNYGSAGRRFNHTVFNFRSPLRNAVMEIERNRVSVGSMDSTILFFTYNINDDKEYERVVYRDNTFKVNGIVSLDYPRTKTLISENIFEGNGSMTFTQAATAKKNRTIGELRSVQKIDRYTDNPNGILFLKNFGSAAIKVEKNTAETANLVRVTFNDLYHYNDQDQLPILLTIKVKTRPALGREQNYLYRIVFKDYRSMYFADPVSGELKRNTPYWSSGNPPFSHDIAPITSGNDKIRLSLKSHSAWGSRHREGYIMLQNLGEVESFEVEASIQKYEYPSGLSENEAIRSTVTGDGRR
jgi:hypothetical protein